MNELFATEIMNSTAIPIGTIAARLAIAAGCGAVLGADRELRDHAAGLRTHILVAVAAATFTIIMIELYLGVRAQEGANADPIRIIEAVTAGVAFLAAGAIFRKDGGVYGLTTGAGMWAAGAIGVAVGVGYLELAFLATAIAFLALAVLPWIGRKMG